jgi:hypothetical protein
MRSFNTTLMDRLLSRCHPRRPDGISIAAVTVICCLLYSASSVLLIDDDWSGALGSTDIDYDRFVRQNRFLRQDDTAERSSGILFGWLGAKNEERESSGKQKRALKSVVNLKARSPEDAAAARQRAQDAASKRAVLMGDAEANEADGGMNSDVYESVSAKVAAATLVATKVGLGDDEDGVIRKLRKNDPMEPYDIDAALLAARAFQSELLFFVYDSATDDFVVLHNLPSCEGGCKRAYTLAPMLAYSLRKNYPERFQGGKSGNLLLLLSIGDTPHIRRTCLFKESEYCESDKWAPILQFGSVWPILYTCRVLYPCLCLVHT